MKLKIFTSVVLFQAILFSALMAQGNETVEEYIRTYKDDAIQDQIEFGIPASITLAQGIHESAAGRSYLAQNAKNHFGIKCGGKWTGPAIYKDDDNRNDCFRKYNSVQESYDDHSRFLTENPRYASLFQLDVKDYKGWAHGLKRAGYATNPSYAHLLIETIEKYDLSRFDGQNSTPNTINQALNKKKKKVYTMASPKVIRWDSTFTHKGLKTFYAHEGKSLTPIARYYNISIKKLLKYNDLKTDLVPYSSYIYLEPKRNKGVNAYVIVDETLTPWQISQNEAIMLDDLLELNDLMETDIPAKDERIYLRAHNPRTVRLNTTPNVTTPSNLELGVPKPKTTQNTQETVNRVVVISEETPTYISPDDPANMAQGEEIIEFDDLVHVVGKGENLNMISMLYRVDKQTIMARNNLKSENIYDGQELIIPPVDYGRPKEVKTISEVINPKPDVVIVDVVERPDPTIYHSPPTPDPPKSTVQTRSGASTSYTVKTGDNLYRIAKKYGVTTESIVQANNKSNEFVYVGERLIIPSTSSSVPSNNNNQGTDNNGYNITTHTVQPGENLYRISLKYNMTIDAIKRLNNINDDEIFVGQKLKVYN